MKCFYLPFVILCSCKALCTKKLALPKRYKSELQAASETVRNACVGKVTLCEKAANGANSTLSLYIYTQDN